MGQIALDPERKRLASAVISVTTRLKQNTAEALRHAASERMFEEFSLFSHWRAVNGD
jgi:hypothetical protein